MTKRIFDLFFSFLGIITLIPIFIPILFLVWIQDFHNPFYIAERVGKDNKIFKMIKIRSMKINADSSGVMSTSSDDSRITAVGKIIRRFKLDELSQLLNVFFGHMSLVGPRPNVIDEVNLYSIEERKLIKVKPGITDFSSIIFSDEGDILEGSANPDLDYNQLIRPGKSLLGIFYVSKMNITLDVQLIFLTILSIFNKQKSLNHLSKLIKDYDGDKFLIELSKRSKPLTRMPPPGFDEIVSNR